MRPEANVGDGNSLFYMCHQSCIKIYCGFIFRSALSEYAVDIQNGQFYANDITGIVCLSKPCADMGIDGVTSGLMTPFQTATKADFGNKRIKTVRRLYF